MLISVMMEAVYVDEITELRILSVRICCVISKQSGSELEGRMIGIRAETDFFVIPILNINTPYASSIFC